MIFWMIQMLIRFYLAPSPQQFSAPLVLEWSCRALVRLRLQPRKTPQLPNQRLRLLVTNNSRVEARLPANRDKGRGQAGHPSPWLVRAKSWPQATLLLVRDTSPGLLPEDCPTIDLRYASVHTTTITSCGIVKALVWF
jgi:hypothetical protein